jgi:hypothetical protein
MTDRPFRHLCPEADERDAMTDDEFWERVSENLIGPQWGPDDEGPDLDAALDVGVCDTCGSAGACAYDSEGRPLIHTSEET